LGVDAEKDNAQFWREPSVVVTTSL
jgi:hypothetical protein